MKHRINWCSIQTVLLDMDGTLLDLYFDNFFWQEYLPAYWGKLNNIPDALAKEQLRVRYRKETGTLFWYCLDFWSDQLKLDILKLKADIAHLIKPRPYATDFLKMISAMPCRVIMVTNAHQKSIAMKMKKTHIDIYFDHIISAHSLGSAKEDLTFWSTLIKTVPFSKENTILIDDNLTVLRTAKKFGLNNLLAITKPDSQAKAKNTAEFPSIDSFHDVMLGFD